MLIIPGYFNYPNTTLKAHGSWQYGTQSMNNIASLLLRFRANPQKILYSQYIDDAWRDYAADEVMSLAARWQQAFLEHGLEQGDRIALCIRNGVNWVAIDQAALGLGLIVVPLYVNDNAENIAWCIANAEARLLVLDNIRMLETLSPTLAPSPTIICMQADAPAPVISVDTWLPQQAGEFMVLELAPDTLASIVYTSGTTGRPKGVKLSHRNILSNVEAIYESVRVHDSDTLVSVLPLSHMFERTCGYYTPLNVGAKVVYSRGINQLAEDLALHRPTVLVAVPRIFERFLVKIEKNIAQAWLKKQLFHLTVKLGWRVFQKRATRLEKTIYAGLKKHVAVPIMAKLGGRLRFAVLGGAAIEARIAQTFTALGLQLIQGYGLTETSPVISGSERAPDPLSVGHPMQNLEVRLGETRELSVRGPSVMSGYWRNPEATRAVLSDDGWLNTGDIAETREGRIYIKGRSKDVLVLSNGEKLPPNEVEQAILENELFEQAMLIGEGRSFLTLLAVTQEVDEKKLLTQANAQLKQFPRYVRVRRVIALKETWSIENGLLTPTLKVKRSVVTERFKDLIERVYDSATK